MEGTQLLLACSPCGGRNAGYACAGPPSIMVKTLPDRDLRHSTLGSYYQFKLGGSRALEDEWETTAPCKHAFR